MQSFAALRGNIQKELDTLRNQKGLLENEISRLCKQHNSEQLSQDFDHFVERSNKALNDLIGNSSKINKDVQDISDISDQTLKSFQTLKYRKSNVEQVLNALTAILELHRIIEPYAAAVEKRDYDECIKFIKQYQSIQDCINEEITPHDIKSFNQTSDKLAADLRGQFEKAIESNNNEMINKISTILFLLHIEEKTVERILQVYERRLDETLDGFIKKLDQERNTNTKFQAIDNYKFVFSQMFVDYLGVLVELIDQYKENAFDHFEKIELFHVIEKLANYKTNYFLQRKFVPTFLSFFDLEAPTIKLLSERMQVDDTIDFIAWLNPTNQVGKYKDNVQSLETLCEEISEISNQCERFKKYLGSMFVDHVEQDPAKALAAKRTQSVKEKEKDAQVNYVNKINGLEMTQILVELLDRFVFYQKVAMKFQIIHVLQNSGYLRSVFNLEKTYFMEFLRQGEEIQHQTTLFEYLDDMFIVMKSAGIRSLSTLNWSISCAFLNFITNNILNDDLYRITVDIFNRYLKKEYFSNSMVCLSPSLNVYNTVIIIIFNNAEKILGYIKNLKEALMEEYVQLYSEEKEGPLVQNSLEELENNNIKKFTHLLDERFKLLAEFLKQTMKNEIDKLSSINFLFNEDQMAMVEEKNQYANNIKNKLSPAIVQWKKQFTKTNFERFISTLCENLARTLESYALSKKYHQLGAIFLDKEIRSIITFLQTLTNINIKKYFARLSQICEMLTLETQEEIQEVYEMNTGDLTPEDVRRIIKTRADFKA